MFPLPNDAVCSSSPLGGWQPFQGKFYQREARQTYEDICP